jgi:hypothetical protein
LTDCSSLAQLIDSWLGSFFVELQGGLNVGTLTLVGYVLCFCLLHARFSYAHLWFVLVVGSASIRVESDSSIVVTGTSGILTTGTALSTLTVSGAGQIQSGGYTITAGATLSITQAATNTLSLQTVTSSGAGGSLLVNCTSGTVNSVGLTGLLHLTVSGAVLAVTGDVSLLGTLTLNS